MTVHTLMNEFVFMGYLYLTLARMAGAYYHHALYDMLVLVRRLLSQ
jgi:hypothetical protein